MLMEDKGGSVRTSGGRSSTHSSQTAAAVFGQKQTIDMMVIRSSVLKIRVVFPLVMSRAWCAHKPIKELRMSKERAQI
jgi:hypothetical protein